MPDKLCFAPVIDNNTRVVILGSLPGEASLKVSQYYAHPRNHFWLLLEDILQVSLVAQQYETRLLILREYKIGLWDVVACAKRQGSLDTALRNVKHNELSELFLQLPQLQLVAFNGRAAWAASHQLQNVSFSTRLLPSSSPAYTLPYHVKLDQWKVISRYL